MRNPKKAISAIVLSNGRITIPKKIRDAFNWKPGHKMDFRLDESGAVVLFEVFPPPAADGLPSEAEKSSLAIRERIRVEGLTFHDFLLEARSAKQ